MILGVIREAALKVNQALGLVTNTQISNRVENN